MAVEAGALAPLDGGVAVGVEIAAALPNLRPEGVVAAAGAEVRKMEGVSLGLAAASNMAARLRADMPSPSPPTRWDGGTQSAMGTAGVSV